jgi:hypothetical protein
MFTLPSRLALIALSASLMTTAHAESVGRAKFELPSTEWTELVSFEQQLTFNGGQYVMPLHTTAYVLPGEAGATPKAIFVVTSSRAGNRESVRWVSDKCPAPRPKFLAMDFGTNQLTDRLECVVVNAEFNPAAFFKGEQRITEALREKGLQLFKTGYSLRSIVGVKTGTYLRTNLMVQRDFKGLEGASANAEDRQEVPEALVAWAEAMHAASKASTNSMGGSLALPPIQFGSK